MKPDGVILKPGKEKIVKQRHHWIFSGAIDSYPENYIDGDITAVFSSKGEQLGSAYFNRRCSLAGRLICFGKESPLQAISQALKNAISMREKFFKTQETNAYRLVNGEGDSLPGLIIDRYNDLLVMQIGTLGMEKLKTFIQKELLPHFPHCSLYEKSLLPSRKEEGLLPTESQLHGALTSTEVVENGLRFLVSPEKGQKTGFFLDQREMRQLVGKLAAGKRVLNCFAYTGGFSIYALKGGASHVSSVEISETALVMARKNSALNGFASHHEFFAEDVFVFLREKELNYDLIILDPPAFAKKKGEVVAACRGYKEINRLALAKMPKGSLLLTCSCSYHVDEKLFNQVLFQAALEAGRKVKILSRHRLGIDHPLNLFHPEGDYLKSLLLYVE